MMELVMHNKVIFKKAVIKVAVLRIAVEVEDKAVVEVEDEAAVEVEDEAVAKTGGKVIEAEDKVMVLEVGDNTVVKMSKKQLKQ